MTAPQFLNRNKSHRLVISVALYLLIFACQACSMMAEKNGSREKRPMLSKRQSSVVETSQTEYRPPSFSLRNVAGHSTLATVRVRSFFPSDTPLRTPDFYYEFFNKEYVGPYVITSGDSQQNNIGNASGVLISQDGYIVTNYHVINTAKRIEVILSDRRNYPAEVVGTDKATDLALLKIKATNLPFLEFGNSDSIEVGDFVLIIGNPLNFTSTVTQGIISYKARNIVHNSPQWSLQCYLQTDGVVNVGNSGGAMVDLSGRLVGIVAAIASPNGVYAGYSFAIPVDVVKKTTEDLLKYGRARRGSFDMKVIEMDAAKALFLNTYIVSGILIESVKEGGGAALAGLVSGDIITKIDGASIESTAQISEVVARSYPGQSLSITAVRRGKPYKMTVILSADSEEPEK